MPPVDSSPQSQLESGRAATGTDFRCKWETIIRNIILGVEKGGIIIL